MTSSAGGVGNRWVLPAVVLPDGRHRTWYVVDGAITADDPGDAEVLPGRFVMPGLVDAHIHLFLGDQQPLAAEDAIGTLRAVLEQGVLAVRDMGAFASRSLELPADPGLPDVIASGEQLAVPGGFFEGCHRPVEPGRLVEAALGEVSKGATWVKVLTDWSTPDLTYPLDVLRQMVEAVHAAGARVAAHSQWSGVRDVVLTGVDSIEHGFSLDEETLRLMADGGVAWVPTGGALEFGLRETEDWLENPPADATPERIQRAREVLHPRQVEEIAHVQRLVPVAVGSGVPVLASTDNAGSVADDVIRLARSGLDPVDALRAATTRARDFLGLAAIEEGAPADIVTYDSDPRDDLSVLSTPTAILLKGRILP